MKRVYIDPSDFMLQKTIFPDNCVKSNSCLNDPLNNIRSILEIYLSNGLHYSILINAQIVLVFPVNYSKSPTFIIQLGKLDTFISL